MNTLYRQAFLVAAAIVLFAAAAGVVFFVPSVFLLAPFVAVPAGLAGYLLFRNYRDYHEATLRQQNLKIPRLEDNFQAMAYSDPNSFSMHDTNRGYDMLKTLSHEDQIHTIESHELRLLLDYMPMGHIDHKFVKLSEKEWGFQFHLRSPAAEFRAVGKGVTPSDAFYDGKQMLQNQIRVWHHNRVADDGNLKTTINELNDSREGLVDEKKTAPTVLIVEDDVDVAMATAAAFESLGCNTVISNGKDSVHQKMSFADIDFIVMDWMLDENLRADEIVEKSDRIIESFTDLREKFKRHRAKVVTISALNRDEVALPRSDFFTHVDHWKKPVQYRDLTAKASELLVANGY